MRRPPMSFPSSITFDSPAALAAALVALACATALALKRRPPLRRATWSMFAAGAIAIALAAGLPQAKREAPAEVAVMVDVSPSTRGATYHDPAAFSRRRAELLGRT